MPGTINFDTKTITFHDKQDDPVAERKIDRYLRFRHLSAAGLTLNGSFTRVQNEGILTTYFGEDAEVTFAKLFYPVPGDLLEIEYPASYGYFLFGKDGAGEWKYTQKYP